MVRDSPISVLVVDDHRLLVQAMAHRFESEPGIDVAATACSRDDALRAIVGRQVDIALLDLQLEADDGIELGAELLALRPEMKLIAVTCSDRLDQLVDAVRAGFLGWVPKITRFAVLADVVRAVHRGEGHIPGPLLPSLLRELRHAARAEADASAVASGMTRREREVLDCMAEGLSRDGIAERLAISPNTVRTHVQSILAKLDVHSSVAAVALWRQLGSGTAGAGAARAPRAGTSPGQL
jgi:DNA-binding NarL/FixJ family response regulator